MPRTTKLNLILENGELKRHLAQTTAEYNSCVNARIRAEKERDWTKQQFESLLRAVSDFGWPHRIEYRADIGAKTADALIRDPEERRTNPVR